MGISTEKIQQAAWKFIDIFYPPFKPYFSLQFFRYGFTGGANMVFDWLLYYLIYHFIFQGKIWELWFVAFSSHIATLVLKWPLTFLTGFFLQRTITFSQSQLEGKKQFLRYLIVTICNTFLVYGGLKCFVDLMHIPAVLSYIIISIISVMFSYFLNRYFSFKMPAEQNTKTDEHTT